MNVKYTSKLQDALINAGKIVEAKIKESTPEAIYIELLFERFLKAIDKNDLKAQTETSTRLIAALLKFQIEKL